MLSLLLGQCSGAATTEGRRLGAETANLRILLILEPQVQNQGVVDGSKETNWRSLKAENSVLFGGFAEDFGSVDRLSDCSEDLLRGVREEPGHIEVFVIKTR